ncbi:hypothetical protein [Clostridium cellulovorans]|uniref:Uncharacterized protein n=1 Tax=Clostridium cellulovorans (strain ATCC 35296 / DSM 3052 / OCM 3 / 743B) TaxID=573061 RepID=D9SN66_CLOC7|nr:hypothetical protein [Clostridium cellulovorans]ADL51932.1 hypothetical protein Clocel_2191 [Clostridium cellulovorans 743B]
MNNCSFNLNNCNEETEETLGYVVSSNNKSFIHVGKSSKYDGCFEKGLLVPGAPLIVNKKEYVPDTIPGIETITLECNNDPVTKYSIIVKGANPYEKKGIKLLFTDCNDEVYILRIYSRINKEHIFNYQSSAGYIKKISWYS